MHAKDLEITLLIVTHKKDPAWTPPSNRQTPFPEAVGGVPVCGGRLLRGSNRTRKTTNR